MRKLIEKVKTSKVFGKVLGAILMAQSIIVGCPMTVSASNNSSEESSEAVATTLMDTNIVKGFEKLMADAGKVLLIIEVATAGVLLGIEFYKLQTSDDQEKPKHRKNIKTIIITAVLVMSATGLMSVILGYFV